MQSRTPKIQSYLYVLSIDIYLISSFLSDFYGIRMKFAVSKY